MKKTIVTAALAALLSAGASSAASAAPAAAASHVKTGTAIEQVDYRGHQKDWRGHRRILPQRVVIRTLYRQGYRDIRNVRLVRGDYEMLARGYRGQVRLVVDGRTGRVLSRQVMRGSHRPGNHGPGLSFRGGNGNFSYSFGIR